MSDGIRVREVAALGWGSPAGFPEVVVPAAQTSDLGATTLPEVRRAPVHVRALPAGAVQVRQVLDAGGERERALRLAPAGAEPTCVDYETGTGSGRVVDVVVGPDGGAVLLEREGETLALRGLEPGGATAWTAADVAPAHLSARLLTDAAGAVYAAGEGWLVDCAGGSPQRVAEWAPAGEPFMEPGGRVGFVRFERERLARDWVLLDPATGSEDVVEGTDDSWVVLAGPLGADGQGRAYGHSSGILGRVEHDGTLGWRISPAGIAGTSVLLAGSNVLVVSDDEALALAVPDAFAGARLVGSSGDGGCILWSSAAPHGGAGTLLYFDAGGEPAGEEAAPDDVWLHHDDARPPGPSAVTPAGEVLLAVPGVDALRVVELGPRRTRGGS